MKNKKSKIKNEKRSLNSHFLWIFVSIFKPFFKSKRRKKYKKFE